MMTTMTTATSEAFKEDPEGIEVVKSSVLVGCTIEKNGDCKADVKRKKYWEV